MGDDEEGTLARLKAQRDQVIEPAIGRHKGRIVKLMGDGLLAEFASVVDALRCAVEVQAAIAGREDKLAEEQRIRWRIGLNLGDVIVDDEDLYGEGVNIAARLEQLAEPGGILVSDDVVRQAEGKVDATFESIGKQSLKNIAMPVLAYRVKTAGASPKPPDRGSEPAPASNKAIVAVLPFKNLSSEADQDYFADGLAEDIVTGLSKNAELFVISYNTTFADREHPPTAKDVQARYGAQFVLEGSVRKAGRRVRVTAQLADMTEDAQLWAERFDRDLEDIFAVQDEIVVSILHALGAADGVLESTMRRKSRSRAADGGTAYNFYLQGRDHFYRHGDAGFEAAEALYEKAISLDPEFGRSYSALAWLHFVRFKLFRTKAFEDIRSIAHDLAQSALRIDKDDFRAHWVLGGLYLHEGKHAQSIAEFDKALRSNPNDANLLAWSAEALVYAGREEDAIERCDRAVQLNPKCPDWYHWIKGSAYFHLGRYEEVLAALERMSATEYAGRLKAAAYAHLGREDEARRETAEFLKLVPGFSISTWARTEYYADPEELARYVEGSARPACPNDRATGPPSRREPLTPLSAPRPSRSRCPPCGTPRAAG